MFPGIKNTYGCCIHLCIQRTNVVLHHPYSSHRWLGEQGNYAEQFLCKEKEKLETNPSIQCGIAGLKFLSKKNLCPNPSIQCSIVGLNFLSKENLRPIEDNYFLADLYKVDMLFHSRVKKRSDKNWLTSLWHSYFLKLCTVLLLSLQIYKIVLLFFFLRELWTLENLILFLYLIVSTTQLQYSWIQLLFNGCNHYISSVYCSTYYNLKL